MIEYVDIISLKPAQYNPRKISDIQFNVLKQSLKKLGFVIPILVNENSGIIVAGHQRTKAANELGITQVPTIKIKNMCYGDEIKFNQLHNTLDKSNLEKQMLLNDSYDKEKFITIDVKDITYTKGKAQVVKEICKLLIKYGNCLNCVICKNEVVFGFEYVSACHLLKYDINAYICDDCKFNDLNYFLNQAYGDFSYEHLKKDTYVQGLAQMNRTVGEYDKKANHSYLYEKMVFPYLQTHKVKSILDFGCGKGAYIDSLKNVYDYAIGLEFYNISGSKINVSKGNSMIDAFINFIVEHKYFDVVVCDSVLNSVDSMEAEDAIMTFLNLVTNDTLFISGRNVEGVYRREDAKRDASNGAAYLRYLDENKFTATYRSGKWYYQKYHNKADVEKLMQTHGFEILEYTETQHMFRVKAKKIKELCREEYIKAIDFEFNLPLPHNRTFNRHEDVKKAFKLV